MDSEYDHVMVTVVGGRNLAKKDKFGTSDPYCWIQIGRQRQKTSIIYNNLYPKWLETFEFKIHRSDPINTEIVVEMYDWDKGFSKDDFMGTVRISLSSLHDEAPHHQWHILQDREDPKEREGVSGDLLLMCQLQRKWKHQSQVEVTADDRLKPVPRNALYFTQLRRNMDGLIRVLQPLEEARGVCADVVSWKSLPITLVVWLMLEYVAWKGHALLIPILYAIGLFIWHFFLGSHDSSVHDVLEEHEEPLTIEGARSVGSARLRLVATVRAMEHVTGSILVFGEKMNKYALGKRRKSENNSALRWENVLASQLLLTWMIGVLFAMFWVPYHILGFITLGWVFLNGLVYRLCHAQRLPQRLGDVLSMVLSGGIPWIWQKLPTDDQLRKKA